ncbi:MAG TPA: glycoside hydrolase domain-containing protein [archaeon]|nr:glycoside hydrolase domain-containing protein [archaeon]
MARLLFLTICLATALAGCSSSGSGIDGGPKIFEAWPVPIEVRIAQGAFTRSPEKHDIRLEGLAGEVLSAQVAVKSNLNIDGLKGTLSDLTGPGGALIQGISAQVRFGAFLPVDETMMLTADPLLEESSVDVKANLVQPVWLTLKLSRDLAPGIYAGKFEIAAASGGGAEFDMTVEVLPAVLPEPVDWSYYLNIWQDPSGVARAHKVAVWSEEHWRLLERYAENFAAHGMKSIMTSIVYDPWKSQSGYPFDTMVEWKYPGEFKAGRAGSFEWDFTVFDRYVELMIKAGVRDKIDCYALVMGPGSTLDANIRYLDTTAGEHRSLKLTLGEPRWREAWTAFLPVFRQHLKEKGWFDLALLGFDEKPEKEMKIIFDFMIQTAPDFKLAASGGYPGDERKWGDEIVFHFDEMTDPDRWAEIEPVVRQMHADKKRYVSWYTACMPYFPNTFLYSPLRESRLLAWLTWKYGFDGYSRWAVNAYPEDVWNQPLYNWHSGDNYFLYPGKNGPLDSMRWELMRQGIQDYETLRIAWEMAGKAGREDLLEKLRQAVQIGSIVDSCHWIPYIEEARKLVNEVIREVGA